MASTAKVTLAKMVQHIGTLLAVLSIVVVSSTAVKCPGTATYTLSWKATWTQANHPNTALPSSAHFSPLIGCSHSADYIMWRRGQKVSPGVKLIVKLNNKIKLVGDEKFKTPRLP